MGQIMAGLTNCLGYDPGRNQDIPRESSNESMSSELKTYNTLVEKFNGAMTYHMAMDECSGYRFHKNNLCDICMRLAIRADTENGHCQPGGPYGFTKLGLSANFDPDTYYDENYPEPILSPRCAKHFPTLEDRQKRYERCSGQSPLCDKRAVLDQ